MIRKFSCAVVLMASAILVVGQSTNQKDKKVSGTDFQTLPTLSWKFRAHGPFFSSPLISDNLVYVGSLDSTLYAIDLSSGKIKWQLKTGGEIRSTVCVNGNQLFFYSGDAILYALDKVSGKVLWTFRALGGILGDRRHDFADYFQSSPVIQGQHVFFGAGDERIYAVDAVSGKLVWSFKTEGIVHTTPALYKDRLFIGSFDGYVYALSQASGELYWKFKTVGHRYFPDGEVQGSPVVLKDVVYVGSRDYNLYAIDAMNGHARWNKPFPLGWAMAIKPRDSVIYVGTSDDRVLAALDGQSGNELWRANVRFNIFGPCNLGARMAYVGTLMGKIFGIDLRDGNVRWTFSTESYLANRLKYFKPDDTFRDDIMHILKTPADFISMEYALGAIFSTPAIAGERMVITSTDGFIYCLQQ